MNNCVEDRVQNSGYQSYCLDVYIDGPGDLREALIDFLRKTKEECQASKFREAMWEGVYILRILTLNAETLAQHIISGVEGSEEYAYDIHYSLADVERSKTWPRRSVSPGPARLPALSSNTAKT